jgi:hypothetical protein
MMKWRFIGIVRLKFRIFVYKKMSEKRPEIKMKNTHFYPPFAVGGLPVGGVTSEDARASEKKREET